MQQIFLWLVYKYELSMLPFKKQLIYLLTICYLILASRLNAFCTSPNNSFEKYKAVVIGQLVKKAVKEKKGFYYTEYKLLPKKWIYKKSSVKKSNLLTIRIPGGELPKKGIVIKASTSPSYIPLKQDAVFFLEGTTTKQSDIFTITKDGIITNWDSKVL
ncbi:MAG: hypothetical protein HYZ79_08310 [Candidatus Melainabacteria bacterium]|nr:hypothetical protein [Candidatus Melainabacteria bacterium]